ncbi:hypothetical protein SLNSH_04345 [Alsobacter soli]|uniref:Tellurium resistance protein TerC n=1 Tax=Alsobacter soli TaxID=2109933 RepID=A0A2T1HWH5_9HYPH|nr:TerC family protein [Alsobacter soli]PSC06047.1 hypothetical protein SLNSH_04345 [Alsobacter soli]
MESIGPDLIKVVQIIWINIILSGDNAVVIALACRGLPPHRVRAGMALGAGVAVLLRIVFTVLVASLLTTPFLKILGSLLLFWIAVKLLVEEEEDTDSRIGDSDRLLRVIRTIAIADMVMSLDNVLAIAAVAQDSWAMLVLGLLISIPLIVAGATAILALIERFPVFVWLGAALLGWVAGAMLVSDPIMVDEFGSAALHEVDWIVEVGGAFAVIAAGFFLRRRAHGAQAVH